MNWDDCYKQGWANKRWDGMMMESNCKESKRKYHKVSVNFGRLGDFGVVLGGTTNKQTSKNDKLGERKCPLDNASKTQF